MSDSVIEELSFRLGLPQEQCDSIIKNYWLNIKKDLTKGTERDILLARFGVIYKDLRALRIAHYRARRYQIRMDNEFRDEQDTISYDNWLKYITVWKILQTKISKYEAMMTSTEKRNKRQKGDRGL